MLNNIVYKGKNYDTTVVFAIVAVYTVIGFLSFNFILDI